MWVLHKPTLADAKHDIAVLIAHCRNLDDATDKPLLETLYENYDSGQGEVTAGQLTPTAHRKRIIENQYRKTSGKDPNTGSEKALVYIRRDLLDSPNAEKCPYCSINTPTQLDHFMDKSTYGQLATCRLNLVPLCGHCNWLKGDKSYTGFMHPYYPKVRQGVIFLVADCTIVRGRVCVKLRVDGAALNDTELEARLNSQIHNLYLDRRLNMAINEFLTHELLNTQVKTNAGLRRVLSLLLVNVERQYGLNDWRAAVVRGLRQCASFDITVVENYKNYPHVVNGGAVL